MRSGVQTAWRSTPGTVVDVGKLAVAHMIQRDDAGDVVLAGVPAPFIVEEKEKFVLLDRAAQACAELIADESGSRDFTGIIEERVRRGDRIPVIFESVAMPIVIAALGPHLYLRTTAPSHFRGVSRADSPPPPYRPPP